MAHTKSGPYEMWRPADTSAEWRRDHNGVTGPTLNTFATMTEGEALTWANRLNEAYAAGAQNALANLGINPEAVPDLVKAMKKLVSIGCQCDDCEAGRKALARAGVK